MLYDHYTLVEQRTQNVACQVDGALIAIWQKSQESFTQMKNVVITHITNIAPK
jgi:hypothetical protein